MLLLVLLEMHFRCSSWCWHRNWKLRDTLHWRTWNDDYAYSLARRSRKWRMQFCSGLRLNLSICMWAKILINLLKHRSLVSFVVPWGILALLCLPVQKGKTSYVIFTRLLRRLGGLRMSQVGLDNGKRKQVMPYLPKLCCS